MCGICGVAALEGMLDPDVKRAVVPMARALHHRGPDGEGFFSDDRVALGHRRLAIIDRAGGAQPIANEDKSCWIVFNGEIYNHRALRQDLKGRGHVFRTASDTEAILHAYEEYGPSAVERLEGMFAFAIYDQRRGELFLARDRLGKKPLFYAVFGGTLHFASEIKAIAQSPLWDDALDLSALEGYLSLGYFLAPRTIYRHVHKLEPGHWLRVANGRLEVRQYWDIHRFDDDPRPEAALLPELQSLLQETVAERLESEVPLGAFLSGGIDSGLVVSFMAEAMSSPVVTTSVGFGHAAHNELGAAELTASRFGTSHHAEVVEPRLEETFGPVVAAFDEPFADSSAIPTYYVSAMARRHVTVALSGDGGDETFGGYDFRYVPHALESRARRLLPGPAGRRTAQLLAAHWPRSARLPRALRLGNVWENLGRDPAEAYFADLCFLRPAAAGALVGRSDLSTLSESPVYEPVTAAYRRCPSSSALQRAQYADLKIYLPNDVLVKVDRMSMAHSLEVRCPLLDRRLVEFAFRLPTHRKLPRLQSKHLLRQVARDRLPAQLLSLGKHGFTAPVGHWLAGPYAGQFGEDVFAPTSAISGLLDVHRVRAMFEEHRSGRADHSYALWAVWVLERWSRTRRHQIVLAQDCAPSSVPAAFDNGAGLSRSGGHSYGGVA